MVGVLQSNGELYRLPSKPQKYTPGGDGGTGLSHVCLERLAYVPTLPEVLRGAVGGEGCFSEMVPCKRPPPGSYHAGQPDAVGGGREVGRSQLVGASNCAALRRAASGAPLAHKLAEAP